MSDSLWTILQHEATKLASGERILSKILTELILDRESLPDALSWRLSSRLAKGSVPEDDLRGLFRKSLESSTELIEAIEADLLAVRERDPACNDYISPFLYFKGFQALCSYRVGHHLWSEGRREIALYLQSLTSIVYSVTSIRLPKLEKALYRSCNRICYGRDNLIDDNVSILHEVTLGGTGKERGSSSQIRSRS